MLLTMEEKLLLDSTSLQGSGVRARTSRVRQGRIEVFFIAEYTHLSVAFKLLTGV